MKKKNIKKKEVTINSQPQVKSNDSSGEYSAKPKTLKSKIEDLRQSSSKGQIMARASTSKGSSKQSMQKNLAVDGVFFHCPTIGPGIRRKEEWNQLIREHLKQLGNKDQIQAACLKIKSLNPNDRIQDCLNILERYVINLVENPKEEKYQYIKTTNKTFQEKVDPVEGGEDFLLAIGFNKEIQVRNGEKAEFLIYRPTKQVNLTSLLTQLKVSQPIPMKLDRGSRVLRPTDQYHRHDSLPDDFFQMTSSEIKKEQTHKTIKAESEKTLKTKAMREKEMGTRLKKIAVYSLVRIRFPDGSILQGTFSSTEKLSDVKEFVRAHMNTAASNFDLLAAPGMVLSQKDDHKTLSLLNLAPAVLLTFMWKSGKTVPKLRQNSI